MMRQTARTLAELGLDGIKIHHLYVTRNTVLEQQYRRGEVPVLGFEEYVGLACDTLERLPETVVVQRLMGELDGDMVVAPLWGRAKAEVLRAIDAGAGSWSASRRRPPLGPCQHRRTSLRSRPPRATRPSP